MEQREAGGFWDSVRAWADSVGLLLPQDGIPASRPPVPESVCANCPICQGAATLDQVNPEVFLELGEVARHLVSGVGSALASAAEQRLAAGGDSTSPAPPSDGGGPGTAPGPPGRGPGAGDDAVDDPSI